MSKLGRALIKSLKEDKSSWELYSKLPFFKRLIKVIYLSDIADPMLNIYYTIRHFLFKIKRILEWLPILWKTEDWDYAFTTTIWAYSLKRLKYGVYDKGRHISTKNKRRRLQIAIALLERISNDNNYTDKHFEAFYKKWGQSNFYFKKITGTEGKPRGPYFTIKNTVEDKLTLEQQKRYNKEFMEVYKLKDYYFKQDIELLFKILKKDLRTWWD